MRMMGSRWAAAMFALIALSGCGAMPASAPAFVDAPDPGPGLSNVYIYRLGAYPSLRTPALLVDGRRVFRPREQAYTVVALAPGTHQVTLDWAADTGWPDLQFPIEVPAGEPLFLKISGDFTPASGGYYVAESNARRVDAALARAELRDCCRYQAPDAR